MPKMKFGSMVCPGCKAHGRSTRVLVRVNEKETLSYHCDECDAPAEYAPKGTQKHADWLKSIERIVLAPAAKPASDPALVAKPAAAAAASRVKMPWE